MNGYYTFPQRSRTAASPFDDYLYYSSTFLIRIKPNMSEQEKYSRQSVFVYHMQSKKNIFFYSNRAF